MSSRTREEKFHIFKQPSLKTLEENFHIYAHPCIILYYSIFIILAVNGPESENSVWFSSLGRCTISATQQFLIGVKQCGEHSLGTRLSFGIECSKVRWGDWFWKKAEVCVVGYLPPFWISLWLKLSHKVTYSFSVDFAAAVTLVPAFRLTVLVFPICHGINLFQSRSLSL